MNIQCIEAFPVPILYTNLGSNISKLNDDLISSLSQEVSNSVEQRTGVDILQTKPGLEKKYDCFQKLASAIESFSNVSIKSLGFHNDVVCHQMWGNVSNTGNGFNMPHSHLASDNNVFTGVYFPTDGIVDNVKIQSKFNTNVNSESQPQPGSLVILDPLEATKTLLITNKTERYPFFGNPICFHPSEGLLVIFPSYVYHMTVPTKKDNFTRISIAFNLKIK